MIIPIRCMTCNKVIGDKWFTYCDKIKEKKMNSNDININNDENIIYIKDSDVEKTVEGIVLDELGMNRYCCRRMFLSNADIIDHI